MGWNLNFFNPKSSTTNDNELPDIFPLGVQQVDFIRVDISTTYSKILTDCIERTSGMREFESLMWDNCLQSEATEGLITLLANAMYEKKDLFLVYVPAVKVLRKATHQEQQAIREDYAKQGFSQVGVYVSFNKYKRTDILRIYSGFEYCTLASLNKMLNTSKALQVKVANLRSTVALADSEVALAQGRNISRALSNGKDVMIDKEDEITTAVPNTEPAEKAIDFIAGKKAETLGMPLSYITGEQTAGMGSTGEQDTRAVERGLKQYFVSILRPVLEALFGIKVEFKSQDFRNITTALEVLKTFEMTSDDYLSLESKQTIAAQMFDLDPDAELEKIESQEEEEPIPPAIPAPADEEPVEQ